MKIKKNQVNLRTPVQSVDPVKNEEIHKGIPIKMVFRKVIKLNN